MIHKILLLGMFIVFFTSYHVVAAQSYTVKNVAVDVEGKTAIDARDKALNQARRNAFNIVMERLSLAEGDQYDEQASDHVIASMVNNFEINREKLSKNRYLASINVTFNERAIDAYVGRNKGMNLVNNSYLTADSYEPSVRSNTMYYNHHTNTTEEYGRGENYTPLTNAKKFTISAEISGIRQWINLKNKLKIIPLVKNLSVKRLSSNQVTLQLDYLGNPQELQSNLMKRGLRLYTNNTRRSESDAPYILVQQG